MPELYAWCNQTLLDHSLGTLIAFQTRFQRQLFPLIKSRVSGIQFLRIGKTDGVHLISLAIALHDIGKALGVYQDSVKIKSCTKVCEKDCQYQPSFLWHEAFSTILFDDIVEKLLVRSSDLNKDTRGILQNLARYCEIAILTHHQAMRDVSEIKTIVKELQRRGEIVLCKEAVNVVRVVVKEAINDDSIADLAVEAVQDCVNINLADRMWDVDRTILQGSVMPKISALICGPMILCDNFDAAKRGMIHKSPLKREIERFFGKPQVF